MSKRNGLTVTKVRRSSKAWAVVRTRLDGSLVAFEDLFDMVQIIIACEVEKYEKNGREAKEAWLRWGIMVQEVLVLSCQYAAEWDVIADRFGLPRRDGTRAGPLLLTNEQRANSTLPWPDSKGLNPDGTWGQLGWFSKELYQEWG